MGIAAVAQMLAPPPAPVLVCCGPGNNGGDGYGAARFLARWGSPTTVLRMAQGEPGEGDAHVEHALCAAQLTVHAIWGDPEALLGHLGASPALILDALFGVGLARPLRAPFLSWIETLNACEVPILSVDVPSGLGSDTGEPLPVAVRAAATATMAAPKLGIAPGATGATYAGSVVEVDIGLPGTLLKGLKGS